MPNEELVCPACGGKILLRSDALRLNPSTCVLYRQDYGYAGFCAGICKMVGPRSETKEEALSNFHAIRINRVV